MTESQGTDRSDADIVVGVTDGAYALVVADFADTAVGLERLRGPEVGRGRAHRRHRGRRRGQARGGRTSSRSRRPPTTAPVRAQVGPRRRHRARASSSRRRSSAARPRWARPAPPPARSASCTTASELADELEDSIAPGHSGILALVSDPGVVEIRQALATADAIVERTIDKVAARGHQGGRRGGCCRGEGREGRLPRELGPGHVEAPCEGCGRHRVRVPGAGRLR